MSIVWPTANDFPQYPIAEESDGALSSGKEVLRTEVDQGPARQRRISTARTEPHPETYRLNISGGQWSTFKTFFQTTTAMGSLEFEKPDPDTGATKVFAFIANQPLYWRKIGPDHIEVKFILEKVPSA